MEKASEQIAMKVSVISIVSNVILTVFKLYAGIFAHSAAMISDAIHTLSDVLSTFIVMIGVKLASKQSDKDHPYGHERLECVAAIILAVILFATGAGIGYSGFQKIIGGNYGELAVPGVLGLVAAAISIVVKEAMYWYTRDAAKKIDSGALMADAWHHRSDALSSIGSFIGIAGARFGYPILDAVACVIICFFIVKAAYMIFMDAVDKITDKACEGGVVEKISETILEHKNVMGIDQIKTRMFGNKIYVDVEICANGDATLNEVHDTAQQVHDSIESRFPKVKHCMVHINPVDISEKNTAE